jgi:hypothetical protein
MVSDYAAYSRELEEQDDLSMVDGCGDDEYLQSSDFMVVEDLFCRPSTQAKYDADKNSIQKKKLAENAVLRIEKDGGISACKTWRQMVS